MSETVLHAAPRSEVKRLPRDSTKVDALKVLDAVAPSMLKVNPALQRAKVEVGATIKHAMGCEARKQFGTGGLMAGVCAGEKVPDYLARIWLNPHARLRLALAWLKASDDITVSQHVEMDVEEGLRLVFDIKE